MIPENYDWQREGFYPLPSFLVHAIDYRTGVEDETIQREGLIPQNNWDLSDIIPLRPSGVFLWGEEMEARSIWHIKIRIEDIDTSKLFAFPSVLACAAAEAYAYDPEDIEELKDAPAIPYAEYRGTFAAEWIYTGAIAPEKLIWKHTPGNPRRGQFPPLPLLFP